MRTTSSSRAPPPASRARTCSKANLACEAASGASFPVVGSMPGMPEEYSALPTRAPIGMGAAPCETPVTSIERLRVEFMAESSERSGGYAQQLVDEGLIAQQFRTGA